MIGRPEDEQKVMKLIRDTIEKIEGVEYPEGSMEVANQRIDRVTYYTIKFEDWKGSDTKDTLELVLQQIMNPCLLFINHAYYKYMHSPLGDAPEGFIIQDSPSTIVTNILGKVKASELEDEKHLKLPGNRADDDVTGDNYADVKLAKMQSMKMELAVKAGVFHFLDAESIKEATDKRDKHDRDDYNYGTTMRRMKSRVFINTRMEIEDSLVELEKEWILTPVSGHHKVLDFFIIEGESVEVSLD